MKIACLVSLLVATVASVSAGDLTSPYADQGAREIKALSAADIADLLAGKGMGYAKAAELNGYPGPAHVLELADELQLSTKQRAETQSIFDLMAESAKQVGAELVGAERKLDSAFRMRRMTPELLARSLEDISDLNGKLRAIHLQAHLAQTKVLTPSQVAHYAVLRGYANRPGNATHEHERS
jgi:hypothetical protein